MLAVLAHNTLLMCPSVCTVYRTTDYCCVLHSPVHAMDPQLKSSDRHPCPHVVTRAVFTRRPPQEVPLLNWSCKVDVVTRTLLQMAMVSPQVCPGPALGKVLQNPLGLSGRPGYHIRVIGVIGVIGNVADPLARANGRGSAQEQ
jgi:hypothetical protein